MSEVSQIVLPSGVVEGRRHGDVVSFAEIPYALAPTGERRFAPPVALPPATDGRAIQVPRATAPQIARGVPGLDVAPLIGNGWERGDDYLLLDVVAPARGGAGLPVMVFVHGGGFVVGSKHASVQRGESFARDGVIYVAMNYRMGIDGFLAIPGVPTNLGLRDILAGLAWVRDNIAAFGGDPSNVTVFGESAGAMAIADLVTSPLAGGLFRRAIIQSGHGGMTRSIPVARRLVAKLAKLLRITPDAAGFASVPPGEALLDAVEKVSLPTTRLDLREADGREPVFGISRFVPVHGDDVLPLPPLEALKQGAGAEIEVLIGSNAEEMNLYLVPSGAREKIGRVLGWLLLRKAQPRAWRVLNAYRAGGIAPGRALAAAMSDLVFRWPARRFAEEHRGRTHVYEFDWRSPRYEGELGAAHGMELPFVFDSLAATTGPEGLTGEASPQALADRIHALWVGFARDGSLPWPAFDRATRQVHRLAANETVHEPPMPAAAFLP